MVTLGGDCDNCDIEILRLWMPSRSLSELDVTIVQYAAGHKMAARHDSRAQAACGVLQGPSASSDLYHILIPLV
jgi:hypothetical protein